MVFESTGTLTTDKRTVGVTETWSTQTDWEAFQSRSGIEIVNGALQLAEGFASESDGKLIHEWYLSEANSPFEDTAGTADGTNAGTTQVTGDYVSGAARSADGIDDEITTGTLGTFGSNLTTDFALAFTIDGHTGDQGAVLGTRNANSQRFRVELNNTNPGDIRLDLSDLNNNSLRLRTTSSHVNDDSPHRVVINKVSNSGTNAIEFWVDQTQVATTVESDDGFSSTEDFNYNLTLFAVNDAGTRVSYLESIQDHVCIFSDSLTQSEIESYQSPWV